MNKLPLSATVAPLRRVILNGNKVLKRKIGEVEQEYEPTIAEEKQDRRNEMKARGTLLMALPNKDQLKFHSYKDAKLLMEAIEKRLQKLISQLEIQGETISQEGMNLKLLRSLPSEWKTHALIWRNKVEIKTISLDDLYNNLNIYELELKDSTNTSQNSQNVVFVSSNSTNSNNSTNEADNIILLMELVLLILKKKMDLQWKMAMLIIRARRFIKRIGRNLDVNGQRVGFDGSKVECYNCHKYGHFARECRAPRNQENRGREINRRTVIVETPTENALVAHNGIRGYDWSYQAEEELPTNFTLMAHTSSGNKVTNKFKTRLRYNAASSTVDSPIVESFVNSFEMLENQENNKSKYDKGYHAVSATFYRNSFPSNLKIMFMDEIVESENMDVITIVTPSNGKKVESNHETDDVKSNGDAVEPKTVRKNNFRPPVIEDWNSDDDSPKESEKDSGMKPTEEDVSGALNKDGEDDQATRNTWLVTAGPSFTNDDPSSPVNVVEASNAFKEHLFERFSPLKNAFILPPVSNVTLMDDTEFFGNAYDDEDVGADADLKNLETTINVSHISTTRIYKDHPKDQIIGDFNSAIQTKRMTKISDEHAMMDVKSAFLYGTIKREVKIWSTSYFEDPQFPDKPRKYVAEILKKFDFAIVKTTSTPMEPNKALVKDEEAEAVDVYLYRSMIGSLKT
ncbi:putative ribonuclease H-like domain-containing protein [Tanacetum coccineum]|uniref:Ribonuclease H-like domain-containing protein n=1 Tax=Tanacetum coccineum TaxID=301880 RepID=A0ABQ4Y9A6_9ASTR